MKKLILLVALFVAIADVGLCCTSAIISGRVTRSGRPILWKNRDTGARGNFVSLVRGDHDAGMLTYAGLFNEGDSLLREAWMGMNEAGFAIMNTASYNLAPDTAALKDCEGLVMARALATCRSLADFEQLLTTMPRPMGVQANFGVIDNAGNGAYYETCDTGFVKFDLADAPQGYITRSNYSESGEKDGGYGYIRRDNAEHFIAPAALRGDVTPELLTDTVSRSFYHALMDRDMLDESTPYIVDLDFVPRMSTTATIAIEGTEPGDLPLLQTMWTALGYPPTAVTRAVMLRHVPEEVQPAGELWRAPDNERSLEAKDSIFDLKRGNGPHYLNLEALRHALNHYGAASAASIAIGRDTYRHEQHLLRSRQRPPRR